MGETMNESRSGNAGVSGAANGAGSPDGGGYGGGSATSGAEGNGQQGGFGPQAFGGAGMADGQGAYGGAGMQGQPYGGFASHHGYPFPPQAGPMPGPMPGAGFGAYPGYAPQFGFGPQAGFAPPPQGAHFGAAHGNPFGQAAGTPEADGVQGFFSQLLDGNSMASLARLFNFSDPDFLKGAAVGAAAVLLLTNSDLKDALLGAAGKKTEEEQK